MTPGSSPCSRSFSREAKKNLSTAVLVGNFIVSDAIYHYCLVVRITSLRIRWAGFNSRCWQFFDYHLQLDFCKKESLLASQENEIWFVQKFAKKIHAKKTAESYMTHWVLKDSVLLHILTNFGMRMLGHVLVAIFSFGRDGRPVVYIPRYI